VALRETGANAIHDSALITGEVTIGKGNTIGPLTLLEGPLTIGDQNWILGSVIGTPPEQADWYSQGRIKRHGTTIGSRNVIREFVTVHSGFVGDTRIGSDCFLMTKAHVGHDAELEDGVTLSPTAMVGGHARIGSLSNVGMGAVIHQHRVVGRSVMVGMNSSVTKDVADYALCYGSPARVRGCNRRGLERLGWTNEAIQLIDDDLREAGR